MATMTTNLLQARLWLREGKTNASIELFERQLAAMETIPYVQKTGSDGIHWAQLGEAYRAARRFQDAEKALRRGLESHVRGFGSDHPQSQWIRIELAGVLLDMSQPAKAADVLAEVKTEVLTAIGPDHPFEAALLHVQARIAKLKHAPTTAAVKLTEALRILSKRYGAEHSRARQLRAALDELTTSPGG